MTFHMQQNLAMKDRCLNLLMPLLPKNQLSRLTGWLVALRLPWPFGPWLVRAFAAYYRICLDEAEHPLDYYRSIGELFTRALKPGTRPIHQGAVHPADGRIATWGAVEQHTLLQAKGKTYTLQSLLQDTTAGERFEEGYFVTYYLCPADYHRVHCPVSGYVMCSMHIPGNLWPVNAWGVRSVENLFAVNERVVIDIQCGQAHVCVVMIGATNVGKMTKAARAWRENPTAPASPLQKVMNWGHLTWGVQSLCCTRQG
jgi:phosphatidylserine decarboxylase